jgi:hypothetical protein
VKLLPSRLLFPQNQGHHRTPPNKQHQTKRSDQTTTKTTNNKNVQSQIRPLVFQDFIFRDSIIKAYNF